MTKFVVVPILEGVISAKDIVAQRKLDISTVPFISPDQKCCYYPIASLALPPLDTIFETDKIQDLMEWKYEHGWDREVII